MMRLAFLTVVIVSCEAMAAPWPQSTAAPATPEVAPPTLSQTPDSTRQPSRKPPEGLLTPIPEEGDLPPIYGMMHELTADELKHRAAVRQYAKQIRKIRHEHFGEIKVRKIRDEGMALLAEFIDPASFQPMIEELQREKDDVRLAMLDHFAEQGANGQAALAWVTIHDSNPAMRHEAIRRMVAPASDPVKVLIDSGLRSDDHVVVNSAAALAAALNITEAIPLLIFAQAAVTGTSDQQGDLAWIAIQTQRAFVAGLQPVVGDSSGAFNPILGVVSDGVVMRVHDAVVIEYRSVVHNSLVAMSTSDWGESTEHLGFNLKEWWNWYNTQYVPFKNEQALEAALAKEPDEPHHPAPTP